jgi:NAD(P)-dependent dehydrogenase (short-subunit alcohol dehydrogenase family)
VPSVLITGANRGLGFEFAKQYLADGWQVYAACRDPDSASELRRLADASGHKLRILNLDVTDLSSVKAAAASSIMPLRLATQAYDPRAFVSAQQCKSDVGRAINQRTPPSRFPAAAAVRAGDDL